MGRGRHPDGQEGRRDGCRESGGSGPGCLGASPNSAVCDMGGYLASLCLCFPICKTRGSNSPLSRVLRKGRTERPVTPAALSPEGHSLLPPRLHPCVIYLPQLQIGQLFSFWRGHSHRLIF